MRVHRVSDIGYQVAKSLRPGRFLKHHFCARRGFVRNPSDLRPGQHLAAELTPALSREIT